MKIARIRGYLASAVIATMALMSVNGAMAHELDGLYMADITQAQDNLYGALPNLAITADVAIDEGHGGISFDRMSIAKKIKLDTPLALVAQQVGKANDHRNRVDRSFFS